MSCSKEEIQAHCAKPPTVDRVETPEWEGAGHVFVRAMRASEGGSVEKFIPEGASADEREANAIVAWCVLSVCDEAGNRLFDDDDHAWLKDSLLAPVVRCAKKAWVLNGETEELAGNLETTESDSSP